MLTKSNKIIPLALSFLLIFEQSGFAQISFSLDLSSYINGLKSSQITDKYRPLHLRYLGYDAKSNNFKLLLDKGDFVGAQYAVPVTIEQETNKLMEYFFIGLSLPNESFWVNLRPDSSDNVIIII